MHQQHDELLIRCPKLGALITFAYCRIEVSGLPCTRALACWRDRFPVESFLKEILTEVEWKKQFDAPAKPKLTSLLELIDTALNNTAASKNTDKE
ncbi:MAG: hypothetical protein HY788_21030 [Deltaproteobacteria bacterium]|nr:hypothetical protein [Deltaproteobacteria bacterium]